MKARGTTRRRAQWTTGKVSRRVWIFVRPGGMEMRSCFSRLIFVMFLALSAVPIARSQAPNKSLPAMATDAHPSFEVVTVRPADPNAVNGNFSLGGHRVTITNQTVKRLISVAYSVHEAQIVGGPDWLSRDRYDVDGEPDAPGVPSLGQVQEMLQRLLADRFGLRFAREKRQMPAYAITVGKGGPKLARSTAGQGATPAQTGQRTVSGRSVEFKNNSMADFALGMQQYLDRPVVDETGLAARFDFELTWTPDELSPNGPDAPPGIFTAVQEQLGLKFNPVSAPVDVFAINHIRPPSDN